MGHFCGIYGVGAVVMIYSLQFFKKNNHKLFVGGFIVGSVVEYVLSLAGEMLLHVKWWDYSDRFLNINGRICFLYSIFWGLLAIYLMKVVNPKIDKIIDYFKEKINIVVLKVIVVLFTIFMLVNCIVSGIAESEFLLRTAVEKDIDITNKAAAVEKYNKTYQNPENKSRADFIYKYWGNEKLLMTYPNITIRLKDGTIKPVREYYPEIKPYYYKWDKK